MSTSVRPKYKEDALKALQSNIFMRASKEFTDEHEKTFTLKPAPYVVNNTFARRERGQYTDINDKGIFDISNYKNMYNPSRINAMTVGDALVDPTLTIKSMREVKQKDPGYKELNKMGTFEWDRTSKVHRDYTSASIIKVTEARNNYDAQKFYN